MAAARRLFAERGFLVPLSAIARDAHVGQGVLYRHFPTRFDLAFAVFEDNFVELERAAASGGPEAFDQLWRTLLELTIREAAFVEMLVEARQLKPDYDGADRLHALVDRTLSAAKAADRVAADVSAEDVLLAWRMVFGVVITAPSDAAARTDVALLEAFLRTSPSLHRRPGAPTTRQATRPTLSA